MKSFIELSIRQLTNKNWNKNELEEAVKLFARTFNDMKIIQSFAQEIKFQKDIQEILDLLHKYLDLQNINYRIILNKLLEKFEQDKINNTVKILTISNSFTVSSIFIEMNQLNKFNLRINVLESLPGGEGMIFCNNLLNHGIDVILENDVILNNPKKIQDFNYIISGCDAYNDEYFVNKIKTKQLVLLAQQAKKEVIVLTEISKKVKAISGIIKSELLEICPINENVHIIDNSVF